MDQTDQLRSLPYTDSRPTFANPILWPVVTRELDRLGLTDKRVFDLGCGNGATADMLHRRGFDAVGVDPSPSGIEQAKRAFPELRLELGSTDDDLAARYGTFPVIVSLEVIEHCYSPRRFAQVSFELLQRGGTLILSTPYHGYLKNLAISLLDKWDSHHTVLWEGGHIKFFSPATLRTVLAEQGFVDIRFVRVGRIPPLAMSMIAIARKGT